MIRVKGLSKSFGSQEVLKGIDAEFEPGKIHGIVGVNGAGKTTFFECFSGLKSHEGEIESSFQPLKNHVGLLQTNPYFLTFITGKEYLQLICNASGISLDDVEKYNVFDLPLNKYASSYSTGMKKKLALTAIMLQNKDVIILDEPFNGVDLQSNMLLLEIIQKLKNARKTILISSHIFSTLKEICDTIYLLENKKMTKVSPSGYAQLEDNLKQQTVHKPLEVFKFL